MIGDNITIRVLAIRGQSVRLGIIAPASVRIDRREYRDFLDAQDAREPGKPAPGPRA